MIIIAVVLALLLFNSLYPAMVRGTSAISSAEGRLSGRMKSDITIIHAAGELDENHVWNDTNGDGDFDVFVWVKNTGSLRITAIDSCDIFFGPEGNFARIPSQSEAGGAYPYWSWELATGSDWDPTRTLEITIHSLDVLASDRYFVKVVIPNGISDELYLAL